MPFRGKETPAEKLLRQAREKVRKRREQEKKEQPREAKNLNTRQKIILSLYAGLVAVMVLYPPYILETKNFIIRSEYSFIWEPIMLGSKYGDNPLGVIDLAKLTAQLLGASLVAGALLLVNGNKT